MVGRQHTQVRTVGVQCTVIVKHRFIGNTAEGPIVRPMQIIRIIRVNMVGGKLSGDKLFRCFDMLRIHKSALHVKVCNRFRVFKRVGSRPVGKGDKLLRFIPL